MIDVVKEAAERFGVTINPAQAAALQTIHEDLIDWNTRINLTAITEPDAVRVRHLLDSLSLSLVVAFAEGMRVIDVGTGAGFPGLVIAVMYPGVDITLMDSTGKKLKFADHIAQKLGLDNVRTLHMRAEDAGRDRKHREQYDVVLARAVARLPALLEYTLPLLRVDGAFIGMKGTTAFEEVDDAGPALRVLGGKVADVIPVDLPLQEHPHYLIPVSKVKPTPKDYPRLPGTPTREPIME
jgi:16S rRNA (guanine527-N7)-methyltransferase